MRRLNGFSVLQNGTLVVLGCVFIYQLRNWYGMGADKPMEQGAKVMAVRKVAKNRSLTVEEKRDSVYISKYRALARSESAKTNIPASIIMAQGLLESGSGQSKLAKATNNHFGIKCNSKKCHKGHCQNFKDDSHKDFFLKFASVKGSYIAHSKLLLNDRYKPLQKCGHSYTAWAYGLKAKGYATEPMYAELLIGIIERYGLYRLDSSPNPLLKERAK